MALHLSYPDTQSSAMPKIAVLGVGGAGGNAINNMIASGLENVDFYAANTDAQALASSNAEQTFQLGSECTKGLGAGSDANKGADAAEESLHHLTQGLGEYNMVFVTAGMGGGTGTGATPLITERLRELGILTVAVVTKPFDFEGTRRSELAVEGIKALKTKVDAMIVVPNQNLFRISDEKTSVNDAFRIVDRVLYASVRSITDLIMRPGLVNLDFADVKTMIENSGEALLGIGEAKGDNRALEAADAAVHNPLLDHNSIKGTKGLIINISGGEDLTLHEVDSAASRIYSQIGNDANVIFGTSLEPELDGRVRVSIVATGIDSCTIAQTDKHPTATAKTWSKPVFHTPNKQQLSQGIAHKAVAPMSATREKPLEPVIALQANGAPESDIITRYAEEETFTQHPLDSLKQRQHSKPSWNSNSQYLDESAEDSDYRDWSHAEFANMPQPEVDPDPYWTEYAAENINVASPAYDQEQPTIDDFDPYKELATQQHTYQNEEKAHEENSSAPPRPVYPFHAKQNNQRSVDEHLVAIPAFLRRQVN